jgi:hypothetical protein
VELAEKGITGMENAIVTGAASGIGRAVREQLETHGDRVIGIDLHDVEVNADLATSEGRRRAIDEALALTGGAIDRLVLAARLGGQVRDGLRVLTVNYFGSVDLLDAFKDAMVGRAGAAAVAISSNASQFGVDYNDPVVLALLDQDEARARELFGDQDSGAGYRLSKTPSHARSGDAPWNGEGPVFDSTPSSRVRRTPRSTEPYVPTRKWASSSTSSRSPSDARPPPRRSLESSSTC